METSGDRQHQLKRRILALRIVGGIILISLAVIIAVLKTVYPFHLGPIRSVLVALAFCVAFPIHRRILRIKTELASLA